MEQKSDGRQSAVPCGHYVLEELLTTEQQFVADLSTGLQRYTRIFDERKTSLPRGLADKKDVLLANISQILALHRDELLPLLLRHQQDLDVLFERWRCLIESGRFYDYVLFTASQRASLRLYDSHELFFKRLQITLGDPLGVRSFLLKPVQRVTKYPLLLSQFIRAFFENRGGVPKRLFEMACRLEARLRELLDTANQSDLLNDIKHFNAFNLLREAIFITVGDFSVLDQALRRCYSCKLFVFNTCLMYAEVKGKKLIFRGCFPLPDVAFEAKPKSFVLYNSQRECEFLCNQVMAHKWNAIVLHLRQTHKDSAATAVALPVVSSNGSTTWYAGD